MLRMRALIGLLVLVLFMVSTITGDPKRYLIETKEEPDARSLRSLRGLPADYSAGSDYKWADKGRII